MILDVFSMFLVFVVLVICLHPAMPSSLVKTLRLASS